MNHIYLRYIQFDLIPSIFFSFSVDKSNNVDRFRISFVAQYQTALNQLLRVFIRMCNVLTINNNVNNFAINKFFINKESKAIFDISNYFSWKIVRFYTQNTLISKLNLFKILNLCYFFIMSINL